MHLQLTMYFQLGYYIIFLTALYSSEALLRFFFFPTGKKTVVRKFFGSNS